MSHYRVRLSALLGMMGLLAALLSGCSGGHIISRDQEIQMGREAANQFERENGGRDTSPALVALTNQLAARIVPVAEPPDYPYDIRVLNNKVVNAVAFPGGRLYLYRGLIEVFDRDPDQIGWVMAHETAHVARRHATKIIERQLGYETVISLVLGKGNTQQIARAVSTLMLLGYSRDEESEADRYGLLYSHAAGFDPTAALGVLKKFQELQGKEPSKFEIMLSTHPGDNSRINAVQAYLDQQGWSGKYHSAGG